VDGDALADRDAGDGAFDEQVPAALEREIAEVFKVASKVSMGVVSATKADGFRIMQNNGEAANQAVAHIHVHVIPSKLEDKGRFNRIKVSEREMAEVSESIKAEIAKLV